MRCAENDCDGVDARPLDTGFFRRRHATDSDNTTSAMNTNIADARSTRVLVLVPPGPDASLIEDVLRQAGVAAHPCADVCDLIARWQEGAGAALLTVESVPPEVMRRLVEVVGRQPPWSDFPLLLLFSGGGESAATAVRMLDMLEPLGNVTVLERPVRLMALVSAVRAALHARGRQYESRDLLAQLESAVRRRDAFLGRLAHELRNPLGAIRNAAHILEHLDPDENVEADQRTLIGRQTSHLARVIDDLLDASRVTSGKVQLRKQPVDFAEVVRKALAQQDAALKAQRHEVTFRAGPGSFLVEGDPRRLEQVVGNLLRNAIHYTPPGGHVTLALERTDDRAVLRVADSGVGIEADVLPRVFNLFSDADLVVDRPRDGLGIGLTLVRALVEMHGGSVAASSAGPGQGSEFVVRLPLREEVGPVSARDADPSRRAAGRRVLVVEDNPDGRETLRVLLQMWGHEVRVACDGQKGVEEALSWRPEVALVDIGLPVKDGYEVARQVRSALERDVFLVALTGYGQPHDHRRAFEAGFDAHLVKPAEPEELRGLVAAGGVAAAPRTATRE